MGSGGRRERRPFELTGVVKCPPNWNDGIDGVIMGRPFLPSIGLPGPLLSPPKAG